MKDQYADEVFEQAGLTKEQAPEFHNEVGEILMQKMAIISGTMGLSYRRMEAFNEQKQALIDDLIKLKAEGTLR